MFKHILYYEDVQKFRIEHEFVVIQIENYFKIKFLL
jgi:hypothetical protein